MDLAKFFGEMVGVAVNFNISLIAIILIPVFIYLIFFVFEGIGLFSIAKREGYKYAWLAFVPFANSYLIGKFSGDCTFCGKRIKKIGTWVLLTELLSFIFTMGYNILTFLIYYTDMFVDFKTLNRVEIYGVYFDQFVLSEPLNIMNIALEFTSYLFNLVYMFFFIIAIINFFRRYSARNSFPLTMWSVAGHILGLPLYNIFIFAVRNNKPVNYAEYMRKRNEEYMKRQQSFYNNRYNNPYDYYGGNNVGRGNTTTEGYNFDPYTGKPIYRNGNNNTAEEPFSDLSGGSDSNNNSDNNDDPFAL